MTTLTSVMHFYKLFHVRVPPHYGQDYIHFLSSATSVSPCYKVKYSKLLCLNRCRNIHFGKCLVPFEIINFYCKLMHLAICMSLSIIEFLSKNVSGCFLYHGLKDQLLRHFPWKIISAKMTITCSFLIYRLLQV